MEVQMKMNIEYVTPDRATSLLSGQIANRPLKEAHIERLVRAVNTGNFKLSPFPVVLDKSGALVDGQHRLTACVRSGSVLPFWMCRLDDGESAIDIRMQGNAQVPPTNSDLLAFERPTDKNHIVRTSIAKFALHMESGIAPNMSVGYHEIRDIIDRYSEQMEWAVALTLSATPLRRLTPAYFGGMALWAMTPRVASGVDIRAAVERFSHRYVSGEGLSAGDPELALRNAMLATVERRVSRTSFIPKFCSLLVASIDRKSVV